MAVNSRFEGGVAHLELSRPERHNAFDDAQQDALAAAVEELERLGPALRCVVVSGEGRSFCSGADLKVLEGKDAAGARRFMLEATWTFRRLERLPAPVLARVHGYCLGGGLELLLHCDLAVVAEDAQLGFPEVPAGLVTTAGSVDRLLQAVGPARARELLLTGRRFTGAEAARMGLVSEAVPASALASTVAERAAQLAAQPPESLAAMKALIRRRLAASASASWIEEVEAFEGLLAARRGNHGS